MKKNDIALLLATALYSFMFYEQSFGVNFLIFTIAVILLLIVRDKNVVKRKEWLAACFGSILSGACLAWFGNGLSVTANIISLSLLSAFSFQSSSMLFALLYSFYSYASSLLFIFIDRLERAQQQKENNNTTSVKKITLLIIPFFIALLFFFMYRGSNPLFNEFAKKINFDFISMKWIAFTAGGFVLLFGFFRHRVINFFSSYDERTSNRLDPTIQSKVTFFGKELTLADENFSGVALFMMLNALLLIVNALDFNFLFIDGKLPEGLSYSEFVHQGIGMLITSIVVAIVIILFYFRGALNFYEKSPMIKFLAFLWILQNVSMLFSTAMRNDMYISEYGLTYKRIGVYVYLLLTAIGLCTTLIKISQARTNMFLFRINSWLFYGVLIIACFVGWDDLITYYNTHRAHQLEKRYLLYLSNSNLPELYALRSDSTHRHKEFRLAPSEYTSREESDAVRAWENDFATELDRKLFLFHYELESTDWRSWTKTNERVKDRLADMKVYNMVNDLQIPSYGLKVLPDLSRFRNVKKMNLFNNGLTAIQPISQLVQLEELDLRSNPIDDYSPLYKLSHLKVLQIGNCSSTELSKLNKYLPNTQIIR